ncbi:hypothetical protein INR49_018961 [Caranx melampygus]|nr:hypothetical protein INR49_018961 [Caranx melampygus]
MLDGITQQKVARRSDSGALEMGGPGETQRRREESVPWPLSSSRCRCLFSSPEQHKSRNIDPAQFIPSDPPPPRRPLHFAESHENEEEKQFRKVFKQLAGEDMEVSPSELKNILTNGNLQTDGFSIESCRSMVAVMDSDSTGKLGFHEFISVEQHQEMAEYLPVS